MSRISELKEQLATLQSQMDEAIKEEKPKAIAQVKDLVKEFGLVPSDVFGAQPARRSGLSAPVAAKYADPLSGKTWSGRGKPPLWIAGKDRSAFAI